MTSFRAFTLFSFLVTNFLWAAPEGFEVETFSNQTKNATAICFDDEGRMYVTETFRWRKGVEDNRDHRFWFMEDLASDSTEDRVAYYNKYAAEKFGDPDYFTEEAERIVVLEDADGDGKAEEPRVFADGFNAAEDGPAIGILSDPNQDGRLLMASVPHIWDIRDSDGDGVADSQEPMLSELGVKTSLSGHDLHGLVWGPDGKLYFSLGDRGYNVTTKEGTVLSNPNSGAAFRCDPDGSNLEVFYYNLRNPQEIAFNELGDLFTVDNNCDQGDAARVCYLIEGGDAGWSLGAQALTTFADDVEDNGMDQSPHWMSEGLWKLRHDGQPQWHLPPIAHYTEGPSGLCFDSGISMPDGFKNHFMICDYKGSPNSCFLYSFKVNPVGAGYEMVGEQLFHAGVPNTDVEMGYDGKVYLADFGGGWKRTDAGNVYAISHPEGIAREEVKAMAALFAEGFDDRSEDELFGLLSHGDIKARQRAHLALAKRGDAVVPRLAKVAGEAGALYPRLHAIWALRVIGASGELAALLGDEEPEIRAQAARALGDLGDASAGEGLVALISDGNARARTFAAIAAGKLGIKSAFPAAVEMLRKNDNQDLYVRHGGIFALSQLLADEDVAALVGDESVAVRLGGCLALRRQLSPRVAEFLRDENAMVRDEAIRACNDLDIPGGMEALAALSSEFTAGDHGKGLQLNEILFRRVINANVRVGTPEHAVNLVTLASQTALPTGHRLLALKALETFTNPQDADPTLGIYRPLEPRDKEIVKAAIEKPILELFKNSNGAVASSVTNLVSVYEMTLDRSLLVKRVKDTNQPGNLRKAALERLSKDPEFKNKEVYRKVLADTDVPELRARAGELWVQKFPEEKWEAIDNLLGGGEDVHRRTGYRLLVEDDSPEAEQRMAWALDALLAGTLNRTVHLDLYEAAMEKGGEVLTGKLAQVDALLAEGGGSAMDFTREGGDPVKGRNVFNNQGLCLKCHVAEHGGGGGAAGPSLVNIARLRRPAELLHSLYDPSGVIVPGYGLTTLTLKGGTTVSGSPMGEKEGVLMFKAGDGVESEIALDSIESRTPEISAMPPMAFTLPKKDVRDLMAYLMELK